MADRGWDATIFAAGFSHFSGIEERLRPGQLRRAEVVGPARFVWLRTVPYQGNNWRRVLNMLSYAVMAVFAQSAFNRPDVIIGSTVHPFAALAGLVAAMLRRVPFVYEIRDLWPQTLVDMGRIRPASPATRLLYAIESALVRRAAVVVTVLPGVNRYLAERGLPTAHVRYIPNGTRLVESASPIPPSVEAAVSHARSRGRSIAAYAGVHGEINRLDVLVRAARACADRRAPIDLLLIGDGPEKSRLRRLAAKIGADNVTFLDPVPKRDVMGALSAVDIAVFHLADTSVLRYGVSSNKLFDYLASRRPIIFACRSGNDPVAEAGAGISISPEDPEAMADALVNLASIEPADRARMGRLGRAYVAEHHNIRALGARMAEVLDATTR
jgi:glycosyltransferase involved in cell wall biosynthesis